MHAHALLNLLNELGKRDKMRGLPSISSLFRNRVNLCLFFSVFRGLHYFASELHRLLGIRN